MEGELRRLVFLSLDGRKAVLPLSRHTTYEQLLVSIAARYNLPDGASTPTLSILGNTLASIEQLLDADEAATIDVAVDGLNVEPASPLASPPCQPSAARRTVPAAAASGSSVAVDIPAAAHSASDHSGALKYRKRRGLAAAWYRLRRRRLAAPSVILACIVLVGIVFSWTTRIRHK